MKKELDNTVSELQNALINDMSWLLKESNDYNMVINVGDSPNIKSFKVHTSVLRARSLYFRAILSSNHHFSSNGGPIFAITQANIRPDVFDVMLKYLYTGRIVLEDVKDAKILLEYIIAAEKLWLFPLIQYIENYLLSQMDDWLKSNFACLLTVVQSNPSSFKLLNEFSNDILKNNPELLFGSDDFYTLSENTLINLLQYRKFSKDVDEKNLLTIVLNWGIRRNPDLIDKNLRDWTSSDFNKLQTSLQRCIPLIRFVNIPPKLFFEIMGPYRRIFTPGLYERIMQLPSFVAYKKLVRSRPSSPKLKLHPTFPSTSLFASILHGFPKPPSKVPSKVSNQSTLSPPESQPHSRSVSPIPSVYSFRTVSPENPENFSLSVSSAYSSRTVSTANSSNSTSPTYSSRSVSPSNFSRPVSPTDSSRPISPISSTINYSRPVSPTSISHKLINSSSRPVSPISTSQKSTYSSPASPVSSRSILPETRLTNSTNPSPTAEQQSITSPTVAKSKYVVRKKTRSLTFEKPKIESTGRAHTIPIVRNKSKPESIYESLNNSSLKEKLKRKSKRPDSAVLEPVTEATEVKIEGLSESKTNIPACPLIIRTNSLNKKISNRKTSIISNSPTSPNSPNSNDNLI